MILSPYDPEWVRIFEDFSKVYQEALGDLLIRIEHVGSTSIRGISAKPIIDIDLVIESYDQFREVKTRLASLGYFHNGDQGIAQREVLKGKDDNVPWGGADRAWMKHHLYVCPQDSPELHRHIAFRDYLNQNADARLEYELIKKEIEARAGGDRKLYAQIKAEEGSCTAFVESILKKAT